MLSIQEIAHGTKIDSKFNEEIISLFNKTFNSKPYHIYMSDSEISETFAEYPQKGVLLLARDDGKLVGFAAAYPLKEKKCVHGVLHSHIGNIENYWYEAELAVADSHRNNGTTQRLISEIIRQTPVTKLIMRTHAKDKRSIKVHREMGFKPIPSAIQMLRLRLPDGSFKDGKRIFMLKEKQQPVRELFRDISANTASCSIEDRVFTNVSLRNRDAIHM